MKPAYQLKISLDGIKPLIWRRVVVSPQITFYQLHHIFQIAMGWANYHLFEFKMEGYRVGDIKEEFGDFGFGANELIDCKTTHLNELISGEKEKFKYHYDFGDSWTHTVVVEKTLTVETAAQLPICVAGKRNCPPEDCGGTWGFNNFLEIINNKKHKDRRSMLNWVGGYYDPNALDIIGINEQLVDIDGYINERQQGENK